MLLMKVCTQHVFIGMLFIANWANAITFLALRVDMLFSHMRGKFALRWERLCTEGVVTSNLFPCYVFLLLVPLQMMRETGF